MGEGRATESGEESTITVTPICAIGASAGGVSALRAFFKAVREDLDLAYVVIVHLSPDHPSSLSEILSSCTAMPVQQIDDARTLSPNCVYVIPPDRELIISGDEITARPFTEPRGRRAPIDMFFRSIAAGRGDGMAVILSGSGADGSLGVRAMKEAGGVIFVQEPKEAEYAMMPQNAIATGVADFVAPVAQLTERMGEVARSKESVRSLSVDAAANDLRRIVNFMRARTGHDFSSYKRATVMRRVTRRMQVARKDNLAAYADYVQDTPEEAKDLFGDLLISVTMFFRDQRAFDALTQQVIPRIFDELEEDGSIRVWIVGCATGEEAYSLAILLLEEAERRKVLIPIQVFATDLDEGALATAREGRYPKSIEADVSEERLKRWFVNEGAHYRICQQVRETVLFAVHSVLKDPPFMRIDLITCRNLLIYLERALQKQIGTLFHYALRPGRYLFLGSAESVDTPDLFTPLDREARLYRARQHSVRVLPNLPPLYEDHRTLGFARRPQYAREDHEKGATFLHVAALEHNAPPSVLVDETLRIVNLSASAGRFILHSGGPFTAELPAVVRPELRLDLQVALERAFETKQPTLTMPTVVAFDDAERRIAMHVTLANSADESLPRQALILFLDGGEIQIADATEEGDLAAKPDETRRLHGDLRIAHDRLSASRRENEISIQDLRAANEELQSINEEYRSTAEELETSKEELQSMNEELQTVNSELKNKLESISTAHSDLRNLTSATEIGTLFLDTELRIRMFTPPISDLFNITEPDVGRAITHFTHQMVYDAIEEDARRVLRDLVPLETLVHTKGGQSYMMGVRPYRTIEDRIEGVVITFVDITARLGAEKQLRESEEQYRDLFDSIDQGFCVIQVLFDEKLRPYDYRFLDVNAAFERQTGLTGAVGKTMKSLAPQHEDDWYQIYGRVALTLEPVRFEKRAASLGRYYEVYAFPSGKPGDHTVGVLFNDVSQRKESEIHLKLMVDELNHRVKNTLAVVQAIAHQTFKHQSVAREVRRTFEGRLAALAVAHNLLTQTHWEKASLRDIVLSVSTGCGAVDGRLTAEGPELNLQAAQAVSIAMALHELCTNAVKYGAFSNDRGRVFVRWNIFAGSETKFRIVWEERDGPTVTAPVERGFGSIMVEKALAHEINGTATIEFRPQGVVCVIEAPLRWEP